MKPEFQKYLKNIGVTLTIQTKVDHFYRLCRDMAFGNLLDIFVDDYLTVDKSRTYLGLSFYSKSCTFSISNFLTENKITITPHRMVQDSIGIIVENFDLKRANENSLMRVELYHGVADTGYYKASGKNCEFLLRILRKYAMPYIRKSGTNIGS